MIYTTQNGLKFKIGDAVSVTHNTAKKKIMFETESLTKEEADFLVKNGVFKESETTDMNRSKLFYSYIDKLKDRLGLNTTEIQALYMSIFAIYPASAIQLVLREISMDLEKKYKEPIEECPNIYTISMTNGKVVSSVKKNIKSYKHFPYFRTIEDAEYARNVIMDFLDIMFKDGE